jgi:hypothetical protein
VTSSWDNPDLAIEARSLVRGTGESTNWKNTSEIPFYPTDMNELANTYRVKIVVPKAQYEKLKKMNLPLFYHLTSFSTWRYVAFDPTTKKAIVVLEGGITTVH